MMLAAAAPPPSRILKRFWLAACALALFFITLTAGNFIISPERAVKGNMLGHDFLAFYTAGHFARTGEFDRMYDLDSVRRFQRETGYSAGLDLGRGFGPFWNPPVYAWLFAPLSLLSYRAALSIWWAFNLLCLIASLILLCHLLPPRTAWIVQALVPLLVLVSSPFIQALNHGQNTFTSLLLLSIVVTLWRSDYKNRHSLPISRHKPLFIKSPAFLAGLVAGLLFYKPQLAAAVSLVLILHLGRRALLGLALTGTFLLAITAFTMPGILALYLQRMPENLRWMQEANPYFWERHVTFKALWRLLLQGHGTGPTSAPVVVFWTLCILGLASALASAIYRMLRLPPAPLPGSPVHTDRLISATIVSMPLLMPFYFDYDLLLLAIPAVLLASELCAAQGGWTRDDRWLLRAWVVFFAWSFVSAGLTSRSHVHVAVVLLSAIALLSIRRACRRDEISATSVADASPPLPQAA